MRPSRKELAARIEQLVGERNEYKAQALANIGALRRAMRELSDLKDEVAAHIVACGHPDTALTDAHSAAIALREHLEARGINLRVELARLEGSHL
ncbi:hypothetical protein ACGFY9_14150 [Streptomyces sp. NPDC048504]|uniref:hypothetical protein n=1 Tax=Streptomyces sp. NPDC048504 TaxID=3365559 RepID=UPI003714D7C1